MVAPVLDEIAGEHAEKITVAKLDIDANPATARDYQVMSIPTMICSRRQAGEADRRRQAEGRAARGPGRLPGLIRTRTRRRPGPRSTRRVAGCRRPGHAPYHAPRGLVRDAGHGRSRARRSVHGPQWTTAGAAPRRNDSERGVHAAAPPRRPRSGRRRDPGDAAPVRPAGRHARRARRTISSTPTSSTRCARSSSSRGLIADGIVGPATYRALREAGWTPRRPDAGLPGLVPDERRRRGRRCRSGCSSSATTRAAPDGVFDEQTEAGAAQVPARVRAGPGRAVRAGHAARAAPARPQGHRRAPAAAARAGAAAPGRARGCAASGSSSTPGTAAPDRGVVVGRRRRGRPDVGPGPPAGRPDGGHRHGGDAVPAGEHLPGRDCERAAFANDAGADLVLSLHTDANHSMHAQGLATFHFGNGSGADVDRRRGAGRLHPARAAHPHRDARLPQPGPHLGAAAADPDARPCGSRSAT